MISIRGLKKVYHGKSTNHTALNGIDLEIKTGEIFGIIGKSGAGKSTLLRCLNLLETPTEGTVTVAGENLAEKSPEALRKARYKIGMIFQHFNLLASRNVYDNIAFPLELQHISRAAIDSKVKALINLVGLNHKAHAYPNELSGGQKQRVGIARALALEPIALLCDEATSALDPETTDQILKLLKTLNQKLKLTIILITHEMDVIRKICDRVAIIENGLISELNTVTNLFLNPKTTVARRFTENSMHLKLPEEICTKLSDTTAENDARSPVIKLSFLGTSVTEPIISALGTRFNITCNILLAHIERIAAQSVGITLCHICGERQNWQQALAYLENLNIKTEVIGYAEAHAF